MQDNTDDVVMDHGNDEEEEEDTQSVGVEDQQQQQMHCFPLNEQQVQFFFGPPVASDSTPTNGPAFAPREWAPPTKVFASSSSIDDRPIRHERQGQVVSGQDTNIMAVVMTYQDELRRLAAEANTRQQQLVSEIHKMKNALDRHGTVQPCELYLFHPDIIASIAPECRDVVVPGDSISYVALCYQLQSETLAFVAACDSLNFTKEAVFFASHAAEELSSIFSNALPAGCKDKYVTVAHSLDAAVGLTLSAICARYQPSDTDTPIPCVFSPPLRYSDALHYRQTFHVRAAAAMEFVMMSLSPLLVDHKHILKTIGYAWHHFVCNNTGATLDPSIFARPRALLHTHILQHGVCT